MVSEMKAMNEAMSSALTALAASPPGVGYSSNGSRGRCQANGGSKRGKGATTRVQHAHGKTTSSDDHMDEDREVNAQVSGNEAGDEDDGGADEDDEDEDEDEEDDVSNHDPHWVRLRV